MFGDLIMAPADPILGLTEAFKKDPRSNKVNLGVGIYKDAADQTPTLKAVEQAEAQLLAQKSSKTYLPIPGAPQYGAAVMALMFGEGSAILAQGRSQAAQTPGGTGGLRVAGDFLHQTLPDAKIWISDPTWENHYAIFGAAGLECKKYPYYDAQNKCLDFEAMMATLGQVPAGDVVLLHGCCHNPSGMDPRPEQWLALAELAAEKGWLPLFDFAYQGFGDGLEADATGLRTFCDKVPEMLIASSFSKNFGLYCERVGALTVVGATADAAQKAFSHIKRAIRSNYSNPPAHGGQVVQTVLTDPQLRVLWQEELVGMCERINGVRHQFVQTLKDKGVERDFSFITAQKGMFSFSGLNREQVDRLREEYAIYIVGSGRINVAGMTDANMDYLCEAIKSVL